MAEHNTYYRSVQYIRVGAQTQTTALAFNIYQTRRLTRHLDTIITLTIIILIDKLRFYCLPINNSHSILAHTVQCKLGS